jgi:4-amino-4-deoxy-L-arabinose transferase-like glycosyltransferase
MSARTNLFSHQPDESGGTLRAWLLAFAIFAFASFLPSRSTLFDRDEPRFAQAPVEMIRSGNWLYPTFNGEVARTSRSWCTG